MQCIDKWSNAIDLVLIYNGKKATWAQAEILGKSTGNAGKSVHRHHHHPPHRWWAHAKCHLSISFWIILIYWHLKQRQTLLNEHTHISAVGYIIPFNTILRSESAASMCQWLSIGAPEHTHTHFTWAWYLCWRCYFVLLFPIYFFPCFHSRQTCETASMSYKNLDIGKAFCMQRGVWCGNNNNNSSGDTRGQ